MSEGQYAVEAALEMELERDAYALWKLQQKETEQREKLKDAVLYFEELKHCANTNNQHAIINEALRLLKA